MEACPFTNDAIAAFEKMADARPKMIGVLDTLRDDLEGLGAGLGVTDPVSFRSA